MAKGKVGSGAGGQMPIVASAADGLPPIENSDELIAGLPAQPLMGNSYALLPCPACGGESASEQDLEMILRKQPHWWHAERCQCEPDIAVRELAAIINNTLENWEERK